MICLEIILIFQHLVWQKNYMKKKMKKENELVEEI